MRSVQEIFNATIAAGFYDKSLDSNEGMCDALHMARQAGVITQSEQTMAWREIKQYVGGEFDYLYRRLFNQRIVELPEGADGWQDLTSDECTELARSTMIKIYSKWNERPALVF